MPTRPLTFSERRSLKNGQERKDERPNAGERGYNHRWRKFRKVFLSRNPLCVLCQQRGEIVAGKVVDHIIPHKGDTKLFWAKDNHQTLCIPCHNAKSATEK